MGFDIQDVMKVLHDLKREMRAEQGAANQSIKDCSNSADDLKQALTELHSITSELNKLKEDCIALRQEKNLSNHLPDAGDRIADLARHSLLKNIDIKDLPVKVKDKLR